MENIKPFCKSIIPVCSAGSGVFIRVTCSICPWLAIVTGALSFFSVFSSYYCIEKYCPHDEVDHKVVALKLLANLKDAFVEAVKFSAADGNELSHILKNRIKKLNTDMKQSSNCADSKELHRLSVSATLALT